jgi:hypothetical protein
VGSGPRPRWGRLDGDADDDRRDQRLAKRTRVSVLPPSWGTLYQLTRLDDGQFDGLLETGVIRPVNETRMIARWKLGRALAKVERSPLGLVP